MDQAHCRPHKLSESSSLGQLFEDQAARTPTDACVVFHDRILNFDQVNVLSNRIARRLRSMGIGREARVAIYLPRCAEAPSAVLGALKSGAAYVPLDVADPIARTLSLLEDAGAAVIVTLSEMAEKLSGSGRGVVAIDTANLEQESADNPDELTGPGDLAYILYTSGTTGKPKGVMIEHRSVVHLLNTLNEAVYAHCAPAARVSLTANLSFDASVKQLFQVVNGRAVCVIPEEARRDGGKLLAYIKAKRIDVIDCTPSLLDILMISGLNVAEFENKPVFLVGGEPISASLWTDLRNLKSCEFYNLYGPTECTVDATVAALSSSDAPIIGAALPGVELRVVDSAMRTVPDGTTGELVIGGPGVARGYLNSPEQTAERFIPGSDGARAYRTGDMVRRIAGGALQFVGRSDGQVKIRGYRVELGEIESAIGSHEDVRSAAVVVLADGRLAGYVVPRTSERYDEAGLRRRLESLLPDYMIPAVFVSLAEMPVTENGKVDKRLLPVPAGPAPASHAAQTEDILEQILIGHWAEALHLPSVGVDDDFFSMGGSSISATQMISNLQSFFPTADPLLSLFFEDPTVAGVARNIREYREEGTDPEEIARVLLNASALTDEEMEALIAEHSGSCP